MDELVNKRAVKYKEKIDDAKLQKKKKKKNCRKKMYTICGLEKVQQCPEV